MTMNEIAEIFAERMAARVKPSNQLAETPIGFLRDISWLQVVCINDPSKIDAAIESMIVYLARKSVDHFYRLPPLPQWLCMSWAVAENDQIAVRVVKTEYPSPRITFDCMYQRQEIWR